MEKNFDIGIIGGGPGGYAAAIRASQKGFSAILFEKDCMGGVCLNRGCIPTKVILHCTDLYKSFKKAENFGITIQNASIDYEKIFNRKNDISIKIKNSLKKLVESYGVTIIEAEAKITGEKTVSANGQDYNCKNIIIATGAKPAQLKGLEPDGDFILNSDMLLCKSEIPQNILIIGSGAIGIEWARIFSALQKKVTVVEAAKNLLPIADEAVSGRIERLLKKDRIKFYTDTIVEKITPASGSPIDQASKNSCDFGLHGEEILNKVYLNNGVEIEADMILCAAGRVPVLPTVENTEIQTEKNFIKTDENFETNIKGIFAIGDVNGIIQLAHAATHQAIGVVDYITEGKKPHFDKEKIPSVIYGSPEIAWVGKTERDLQGKDYKVSIFPVAALGKAQADDEIDGFIKVLSLNEKIVGAHIVAPEASALIQQFALMIDNELTIKDILKTTFAHPTYSEGVFEALLGLEGLSLSLPEPKH